ncbi:SAM-dependent methyltransferase [Bradyrhizobium japonicum]|jgi:SAM-dependent methyltransferase|uniref:class I SAM-dependent methyltransferase n=1 Tax=Bradyrhizobium TaxID=374 RepID=UPI0003F7D3EA|nr:MULTISPECIES: class I SAM-dependent methyltransferase [Bradyrhizobium]MBR0878662.1 methyltransferase domain-containing protein [Bradyrhizobium liaoningense]MBR0947422.1 methyltransferase domain-containing protein [Bradyrhizobium liaoningense]MBR1000144.1 methyltransferase domain-containing protein [Bradyrhizobium liaoningense]MBR1064560.1 methyltransferase domain-containing protein [Bradyrhizobium liaoningense]MCP1738159.1 SAM-dependent methyltransferase [Bradyrhizobium japonicum]
MGRFASTASLYEHLRPPYPSEFFRSVAHKLGLTKQSSLIDLGTGPGLLALGFGPYVGRVVGVDPEPEMIEAARRAAAGAGRDITLIEGKAETLASDIGSFDVVTIGRALHWMDRDLTLALLDRLVAHDGAIAICASFSATDGRNPWLDGYNEARRRWSPAKLWEEAGRGTRTHRDLPAYFRDSSFQPAELVSIETSHLVGLHDLAERTLTYSSSSPDALGENADEMLRDVGQHLAAFSRDGAIAETVVSTAQIVKR